MRMNKVEHCIRQTLPEVGTFMERAFAEVGGSPVPGSALDQVGLIDGVSIVEDYLRHGEPGIALEHLIYMSRACRFPSTHSSVSSRRRG